MAPGNHQHKQSLYRWSGVFFDMDGVLVDSASQIDAALRQWAAGHGVDIEEVQEASRSMTDVDFLRWATPWLDAHIESERIQQLEAQLAEHTCAIPGALDLFHLVPATSRAVVTNGCSKVAYTRLRAAGYGAPEVVITVDDVVHGKPHPEPYERAMKALGVSAHEGIAVEDSVTGATSASRAGLFVVGFDQSGDLPGLHAVADLVVDDLAAVPLFQCA